MASGRIGPPRHRRSQIASTHSAEGGTDSSNPAPSSEASSANPFCRRLADYPDEVLRRFDFIIGSIHGQFRLSREAQTER